MSIPSFLAILCAAAGLGWLLVSVIDDLRPPLWIVALVGISTGADLTIALVRWGP